MENKTEQVNLETDWRNNITDSKDILKLKDGDIVVATFADEGVSKSHPDYGNSVAFQMIVEGEKEPKIFYVKSNNFSLLAQIKLLGILTGQKVKISRVGSKKSDTRYKIVKFIQSE
jgi:hypothetical protein